MKKKLLFLSFMMVALYTSSQTVEVSWLNDYFQLVDKRRAAYKQEMTEIDSVVTIKLTGLNTRREIIEHYDLKKGIPVGKWQEVYNGQVKVERDFDSIVYILEEDNRKGGEMLTDTIADVVPSFPGGEQKRIEYMVRKTKYPRIAQEIGISGTTQVSFIVTTEGKIVSVAVYNSSHPYLDYEAVRIIKAMPDWIPGTHKGQPVTIEFHMPIKFTLAP